MKDEILLVEKHESFGIYFYHSEFIENLFKIIYLVMMDQHHFQTFAYSCLNNLNNSSKHCEIRREIIFQINKLLDRLKSFVAMSIESEFKEN